MSLLDLNLSEVKDLRSVEPGEYKLKIVEIKQATSKNGNDYLMARLTLLDVPDAKDINHLMMLPAPFDDDKKKNARLRSIKNFMVAFKQPLDTEINLDNMAGAEGWALLTEEEDEQYGTQNRVKRFM